MSETEVPAMLDRLFGPGFVARMNWHAEQAKAYWRSIQPAVQVAEQLARQGEEWVRIAEHGKKRSQKFDAFVRKIKWPPPGHLPCTAIDRIVDAFESGTLSDSDVEELFLRAYSPNVLAEIETKWASYEWLNARLPILREGIANYLDGRFYSVVCVLMPQLEGLFGVAFGRKPKPEQDVPIVCSESVFGSLTADYYLGVILETFNAWDPSAPVPELSRHAILHGRATEYGTKSHALKMIIITDYLLQSFNDRRTKPEASEPE